jgi:hypothetical protein
LITKEVSATCPGLSFKGQELLSIPSINTEKVS